MKKTLSPGNSLLSASLLLILAITNAFGQGLAPAKKVPRNKPLEFYGNPPAPPRKIQTSPRMMSTLGVFTSYQVNVDQMGNNILGDAANEPSITVDPTNHNRMAIGWRQFNSVQSDFRQGGWGFTTDGGTTWTFPGVLENNVFRSDPVLGSDETGNFFYLSLLQSFCDNMYGSLDFGQTWTRLQPDGDAGGGDKQWFTIDKTNGPGHGFQYQSDDGINCSGNGVQFQRSTDGGVTWQAPIVVPNGTDIGTLDVASNGNLFIGGEGFDTFYCVRSSNAQFGGQTPTFDQITPVNLGGSLDFGDTINPGGLAGQCFLAVDRSGGPTNNNIYMLASVQPTGFFTGTDVMFARSTDGGLTFSAPHRINDDPVNHNKWHWFGTFSVAPNGRLDAVWYDTRNAANNTDSQLFYSWSTDAGVTWSPNVAVGNAFNPHEGWPVQQKIGDYITIVSDDTGGNVAYSATFNFNPNRGQHEEDVYYVRVSPPGLSVSTTDPACNSVVFTQPTDFTVNVSMAVDPTTLQASDFTCNGVAADNVILDQNQTTIHFHFNNTPVTNQGVQTMHIPAGSFSSASSDLPVSEFQCTFRYDATLLAVTSTNPPVGGTFTGPATLTYDVNFNEPVDPNSISIGSLHLSGIAATVTNVQVINTNMTAEFTINFTGVIGGTLTASIPAGTITDQFGNPNATFSGDYQYNATFCDSLLVQNQGFETGNFPPWAIDGFSNPPVVTTDNPHSGTFSALAGSVSGSQPNGNSSFYQQIGPVPANAILSFWHWDSTGDIITSDSQNAYITNTNGVILQTIFHQCENGQTWLNTTVDMTPYAGQTVRVKFVVHQNGAGGLTGMYVDDVILATQCAAPSPTPTPALRATPTPRPRPTPHPRP